MRVKRIVVFAAVIALSVSAPINAANNKVYGEYTAGNIKIISYAEEWPESKLPSLYTELLNNFYGEEISYLGEIDLYSDSPGGVNGHYYQDITSENGTLTLGNNAKISLYNCARYNNAEKIAPVLSHEYGHHYTTVNIFLSDGRLYNDDRRSKYSKIRGLKDYPVVYSYSDPNYSYRWDVGEILACDYVQLLGSPNAKRSVDYPDSAEKLLRNTDTRMNHKDSFNLIPQINPEIPLAADVDGLYSYMLSISGYAGEKYKLISPPSITEIERDESEYADGDEFTIHWSAAEGNSPFEYTVYMYPSNNPFTPVPIKTVTDGEELTAYIGTAVLERENGEKKVYTENFEGEYIFMIHAKDKSGFLYSSKPYSYNFDKPEETDISTESNKKSFWRSLFEERNR